MRVDCTQNIDLWICFSGYHEIFGSQFLCMQFFLLKIGYPPHSQNFFELRHWATTLKMFRLINETWEMFFESFWIFYKQFVTQWILSRAVMKCEWNHGNVTCVGLYIFSFPFLKLTSEWRNEFWSGELQSASNSFQPNENCLFGCVDWNDFRAIHCVAKLW